MFVEDVAEDEQVEQRRQDRRGDGLKRPSRSAAVPCRRGSRSQSSIHRPDEDVLEGTPGCGREVGRGIERDDPLPRGDPPAQAPASSR